MFYKGIKELRLTEIKFSPFHLPSVAIPWSSNFIKCIAESHDQFIALHWFIAKPFSTNLLFITHRNLFPTNCTIFSFAPTCFGYKT
jgi:hypothetical protein